MAQVRGMIAAGILPGKTMKSVLAALAAAALISAPAWSQDDPLPQSVASPYLEYEVALEAGDGPAAMAAARQAWQAAERARIDRSLLGILAANYGDVAYAEGEYEAADEAWLEAARIGDNDPHTDAVERSRRWYMAGLSAFADNSRGRARNFAGRAADRVEAADVPVPANLRAEIYFLYTRAAVSTGAWWRLESSAGNAIEAFEELGADANAMYAYCYYMLGLSRYFWGEREDSVMPFHMAGSMYASLGERFRGDAQSSAYWFSLVTNGYDDVQKADLHARIAATAYPEMLSRTFERNTDTAEHYDTDAQPVRREIPDYPRGALMANLDGVALVRFDVNEDGRTENAEVVASAPPQIFDEAAVEAVEDWRYDPAVIDGEIVRRTGVLTEFRFSVCQETRSECRRQAREEEQELLERDSH